MGRLYDVVFRAPVLPSMVGGQAALVIYALGVLEFGVALVESCSWLHTLHRVTP